MDLDARPLRFFIAVAEMNSFSRAASRVNVSQPALSATIKELERRIGFVLFDRGSRHVRLTTEGKLFLANARRYVRESDILRQAWLEIGSNDLRISAAFHTCLIDRRNLVIESFLQTHTDVRLQIINDNHERGLAKLAQGEVDLTIAIEPSNSQSDIAMITERKILSSRCIGILVPVEHPLATRNLLILDDLCGYDIVIPNRFHGVAVNEQIRSALNTAGANIVRSPEGSAMGVARYGAIRRLPAIALNWFTVTDNNTRMTLRVVEGLGTTYLSLIRASTELRPVAQQFWDYSQEFVE